MFQHIRNHLFKFIRMSYVKNSDSTVSDDSLLDCALGVNPYGCSTQITHKKQFLSNTVDINNYPHYPYTHLKKAISAYWSEIDDIDLTTIKVGSGSQNILSLINKIFLDKNSKVLGYCPQFTDYVSDVLSCGGLYESVKLCPDENYRFNETHFTNQMRKQHSLIYIDNPNNPTGQIIPLDILETIIFKAQHMGICVIIDEAYGDFMTMTNSAIPLAKKYNNLFVVRTLSKGMGLAGLRIGYMICSQSLQEFYNKVEAPFSINIYGEIIAQIALQDRDFITSSIVRISHAKQKLINACQKLKVLQTSVEVPILVLQHPDETVNLYALFLSHKVATESGSDFENLGKNFVRLRIPSNIDRLINTIKIIEEEI